MRGEGEKEEGGRMEDGGREEEGRRGGEEATAATWEIQMGGRSRRLMSPVGWAECRGPRLEYRSTWDRNRIVHTRLSYSYN